MEPVWVRGTVSALTLLQDPGQAISCSGPQFPHLSNGDIYPYLPGCCEAGKVCREMAQSSSGTKIEPLPQEPRAAQLAKVASKPSTICLRYQIGREWHILYLCTPLGG